MLMRVIGITGTFGAGKGTVVEYLQEGYRVKHFSGRAMIAKCAYDHYGVTIKSRDDLRINANKLRKEFGPDILVRTAADCADGQKGCHIAIIESIRCLGEIDYLIKRYKNLFSLLAVDTEKKERFRRAASRGDITDKVSFEEFCRQESIENASALPWEQNLRGCIARANRIILNNGSKESLRVAVDKFLYENII
jgi:hypothetical protein